MKELTSMTPYELGETGKKEAIEYLILYLSYGDHNQKKLAASGIKKLYKIYPFDCLKAKEYLIGNLKEKERPQLIQYTLLALNEFELNIQDKKEIIENTKNYDKYYILNIIKDMEVKSSNEFKSPYKKNQNGWVYFLKEELTNSTKIGRTKDLNKRINNLGLILPFETELVFSIKCVDHFYAEIEFQKFFKDKRRNGEWFDLTEKDINWIKNGKYTKIINDLVYGESK
jgi:hypothetical protein